jgi:hypothetical protein
MPNLAPNPAIQSTAGDIIKDALYELNALSVGEEIQSDDGKFCLRKLNRILDQFNGRSLMIFNVNFTTYTLKTNRAFMTIGPGGDFDQNVRPAKLKAANLLLPGGPVVNLPLNIRDDAWWADNRVQTLTSTIPTDVYYSDDNPLGRLYFWPVPTVANQVQIETWVSFTLVSKLDDPIVVPQGYWNAIVYSLAIELAPSMVGGQASPILAAAWQKAMSVVQGLNSAAPRMDLRDSGLPGKGKGHFDWRTGGINV